MNAPSASDGYLTWTAIRSGPADVDALYTDVDTAQQLER
jgi:hypothetical protein